jgi:alpha-acetolactate decarboxylase
MSTANQTPRDRSRHWAKSMTAHPSNMGALPDGVYDGDVTIADIRRYGDSGLGTFNHRDGENVVLDGNHDLVTTNVSVRILD